MISRTSTSPPFIVPSSDLPPYSDQIAVPWPRKFALNQFTMHSHLHTKHNVGTSPIPLPTPRFLSRPALTRDRILQPVPMSWPPWKNVTCEASSSKQLVDAMMPNERSTDAWPRSDPRGRRKTGRRRELGAKSSRTPSSSETWRLRRQQGKTEGRSSAAVVYIRALYD
jgi:hypothetical protein